MRKLIFGELKRRGNYRRKGIYRKCATCGKNFYIYPSKISPTVRFCSIKCYSVTKKGNLNYFWKGGTYKDIRERPRINGTKTRLSRIIVEEKIGRKLKSIEVVHHINKNTLDNRIENLYIFQTTSEHSKYHSNKTLPELKSNICQDNYI